MIEIKSVTGSVIFKSDNARNLKEALEGAVRDKANLTGANLKHADLRHADLIDADLTGANLTGANLTGANLKHADLRHADLIDADLIDADLTGANLTGAKTDKRYIQVGCIGSAKRLTTYCFDDDIVWCGCFTGSLEEFEKKVRETHANNEQFLKEYLGLIKYIKWNL